MSKRGRRRSSRRRKSSSSSKQSVSPYIFHKQNKSNSISYKEDVVEKGEADSLRKENAPSGSDDEEKYNHDPPKEKRFKQDHQVSSYTNQRSIYWKTTEDRETGMKIVTSVSVNDVEDSIPKITFQQSHEPLDPPNTSRPLTNIMNINCSGSHVKLEIQEILQKNTTGIKTTLVFMNKTGSAAENTCIPNNDAPHLTNHSTNYRFTFGTSSEQAEVHQELKSLSPASTWGDSNLDQNQQFSDFIMENHNVSPPPLFNSKPVGKRRYFQQSFNAEEFWDIPPPREFADAKKNSLMEEITQELASCRIKACSPADEHAELYQPSITCEENFSCMFSEEQVDRSPSFDQLSEFENYDLMRPSVSTNRSSFTKHFINCQKRKSWIRHNSISTVEHRPCSIPQKRRQTYPVSEGLTLMQDQDFLPTYTESFSSLLMCSFPLQSEGLEKLHQVEDEFSALRIGSFSSSQRRISSKTDELSNGHNEKQLFLSPYYVTSSEETADDSFTVMKECRRRSTVRYQHEDLRYQELKQRDRKDPESLEEDDCEPRVEQSEIVDSGFDQEMGEVEFHSPEPLTEEEEEELSRRALMIQVIPPSSSGSEEQILQTHPAEFFHSQVDKTNQKVPVSPIRRRSSAMTVTAVALEQRLLQVDSTLSLSSCVEKQRRPSESLKDPPITKEVTEETVNSSPPVSVPTEEAKDKPAASIAVRGPSESREPLSNRIEKPSSPRSSLEAKEQLKPDSSGADHWAKRRKMFRESKQMSSAAGSSITSDITDESVEETRSMEQSIGDNEDRGFYTETFHSSAWIYHGDDKESIPPSLNTRTRAVSIRERTVKINKGTGEYPWGFRIQFSKPIVVTEVDTNGAAEEAGLIVGDYVLAVNGTDVTSIPHSEAAELARQGPDILTLTVGSDIARGPNTPRPACRGYLHKRTQTGLIKGWRKRWFVLTHDCCLYYYRHKRDEGKHPALSAVKLEGAEVGPDISLGKPFVFRCRPHAGNRIFFFCATSNQEMKRWLEAMERAVHPVTQKHVWVDVTRHNASLPPLAVKNPECLGLLHKMDRSRDTWVQNYCILKDGCLALYSGIRATHARGGIYLQGYSVREQPYGSKKSTIELKPPSDEFKTFYFCAENPNENKRWISALKVSIKKWLPLHQALQDYMCRLPDETRM